MGIARDCACSYGCVLDLCCADMQSEKENPQQESSGNYRSCSICARCFGSYCARPDSGTHINRHGGTKTVILNEQIDIQDPYEKMETGAANFEEEFVKWSPYYIERNLYNGTYHVGSKIRFREIVMGLDYDVTGNAVNESLLGDSKNGSDRTSSEESRFIPPSM